MAEQTNFYALQRGAPRSFKAVSDGFINLYLYITSTQTVGEGQRQFLDVPYVKLSLCNVLCFAQFHAKIHNIKKKQKQNKKRLIVR